MMEEIELTHQEKVSRSKIQMMWFGIASLVMMFAGLTSAYVVSRGRKDWVEIDLPQEFFWSTGVILLSSFTLFVAKKALLSGNKKGGTLLTVVTFILGSIFVYMQFAGFENLVNGKIFLTGAGSSVNASFIYVIVLAHLAHIVAGLIALLVMTIRALQGKYSSTNMLGFELGAMFWHFVDVLWIYLLLFLVFARDIF